jgi:hypothetical protein
MRARAALLTVLAGAALVAVPARPAAAAACSTGPGVTVVVDFASLGGGEPVRCTSTDPATGLAALRDAGFSPTRAAQQPGYFVCRIDGKPASDPCQRTSPASAYWSYWHAKRGGSWTYSDQGAADYDPPAGSVEGWAFGAGKPPSTPPPPAAQPAAAPAAPSAPPASGATPRASASRLPAAPAATAAASPLAAAARTVAASAPASAAPSTGPSPASNAPPTDSPVASPAPDAGKPASGSGPVGPLLAALVVAALVAAAVRTVVRRRRSDTL